MNIYKVLDKALELGLSTDGLSATEVIHLIQIREGNEPCFGTNKLDCKYRSKCLWNRICLVKGHSFEVIE